MTYHDLSESTLSPDERWQEANKIIGMLDEINNELFTEAEYKFIHNVSQSGSISVKQLFWLRDIKDKYL